MTQSTAHADRKKRMPITPDRCYGYQRVSRPQTDPDGYKARLWAIDVNDNVWTRVTTCPDTFHQPNAIWTKAGVTAEMAAAYPAEYVGTYAADKIRKNCA